LFRSDDGVVARELAVSDPDAFVIGQFITLYDPGVLFVAYAGKRIDTVRAAVDRGLALARKPLSPQAFGVARLAFEYNLFHDLQTPTQLADNFGWYSVEGNLAYAPGAGGRSGEYFKAAESLTPDFVAAVAEKYLTKTPAVVSLRPQAAREPSK
jgi:predicted Zn-dependent peptidase